MRNIANRAFLILLLFNSTTAGSQTTATAALQAEFRQTVNDPAVRPLAESLQSQASAVVQGSKPTNQSTYANSLFASTEFKGTQAELSAKNRSTVDAITDAVVSRVREGLPKLGQAPQGNVQFSGNQIILSSKGPDVLRLISELVKGPYRDQVRHLDELNALTSQEVPEALHFAGYMAEYGLYGRPKDMGRAIRFYQASAGRGYQPALFNLGLIAFYGKAGKPDLEVARQYLAKAAALGSDYTGRVCGITTFLNYRLNLATETLRVARSCGSPLADLGQAKFNQQLPIQERMRLARNSLVTGVNDALWLIEEMAETQEGFDPAFMRCKYRLITRALGKDIEPATLRSMAESCVKQHKIGAIDLDQAVTGVTNFVIAEITSIQNQRKKNFFRYGETVPFLPFTQADADLFAPLIARSKKTQ